MVDTYTKNMNFLLFLDVNAYLNTLQCITWFMVVSSNVITNGSLSMKKFKFKPLLAFKMNIDVRHYSGIYKILRSF